MTCIGGRASIVMATLSDTLTPDLVADDADDYLIVRLLIPGIEFYYCSVA